MRFSTIDFAVTIESAIDKSCSAFAANTTAFRRSRHRRNDKPARTFEQHSRINCLGIWSSCSGRPNAARSVNRWNSLRSLHASSMAGCRNQRLCVMPPGRRSPVRRNLQSRSRLVRRIMVRDESPRDVAQNCVNANPPQHLAEPTR